LIDSLTDSSIHPFIQSAIHSLTHSLTHSFNHPIHQTFIHYISRTQSQLRLLDQTTVSNSTSSIWKNNCVHWLNQYYCL